MKLTPESRRRYIDWLGVSVWILSGMAMAGGLLIDNLPIFGSGLFTFLVSVPIYMMARREGQ